MQPVADHILCQDDLVEAVIADIDRDPFQSHYRKKPYNALVKGWGNRLASYYWPTPDIGLVETMARLAPLLQHGRALAESPRPWSVATREMALQFAQEVFAWGAVPQRDVSLKQIDLAVQAALFGRQLDLAPMNSGWTKLAAFVTAHLEEEDRSQAIWDSRVSWSLVRRFDRLLHDARHPAVPVWLKGIGKVPGRGGTRWAAPLKLDWPYAYRRWDSHLAAASVVRAIRDQLNASNISTPRVLNGAPWTVRSVEMVLFMDGY